MTPHIRSVGLKESGSVEREIDIRLKVKPVLLFSRVIPKDQYNLDEQHIKNSFIDCIDFSEVEDG